MNSENILEAIIESVGNAKGLNISVLDVKEATDMTDFIVIVTGSSNRHVKSIMRTVVDELRDASMKPIGLEGEQYAQWILIDYNDVIVNVMLAETREFYDLESLWEETLKMPLATT